jgi:hypothetical protein
MLGIDWFLELKLEMADASFDAFVRRRKRVATEVEKRSTTQ